MRATMAAAAALGLVAGVVQAAELGRVNDSLVGAGDRDVIPFQLEAGEDYALGSLASDGVKVTIREPANLGGRTVLSFVAGQEAVNGREFRTRETVAGRYEVELVNYLNRAGYPVSYLLALDEDCKASKATRCQLAPGGEVAGRFTFYGEADWYKLPKLKRARAYRLEGVFGNGAFDVVDLAGNQVAGPAAAGTVLSFTVPEDGAYLARFFNEQDGLGSLEASLVEVAPSS